MYIKSNFNEKNGLKKIKTNNSKNNCFHNTHSCIFILIHCIHHNIHTSSLCLTTIKFNDDDDDEDGYDDRDDGDHNDDYGDDDDDGDDRTSIEK